MSMKNISKIILIGIVGLLYSRPLFADAPYERYHVEYRDISKDVLKNTIGILTIGRGTKETEIKTYSQSDSQFTLDKILKVKETTPISNFDYQPSLVKSAIANYRYPIVSESHPYLLVVYDPKKNSTAWMNIEELEQDFVVFILMLDSLPPPKRFVVDIFSFTEDGKRMIYAWPGKRADSVVLSKDLFPHSLLNITERQDGFIKLEGLLAIRGRLGRGSIQLSAWTRIRDEQGNLSIWLIHVGD